MPASKKNKAGGDYGSKSIQVLEGLEPVRKRPGMFIGSTGLDGLHHMVKEVADNSIDEALAGYADQITVTLLNDGGVRVTDNGRGIPVEKHAKTKKSALETVMTILHAGGKFDTEGYKVSSGLHGVGVSVVNALAIKLVAEVHRDGALWRQEYSKGKPKTSVERVEDSDRTGTTITFWPDHSIMQEELISYEVILDYLRHQAYLTKAVKTMLVDERTQKRSSFYFEGGIQSYVRHLNRGREVLGDKVFYVEKVVDDISVEVSLQYNDSFNETVKAFANNVFNSAGGTHLVGFRAALTRVINDYARSNNLLKDKDDNLTGDDVREGLTAVILVKITDPQFEGQTKNKLGNPEVRGVVEKTVNEYLAYFFNENPSIGQLIVSKALLSARARKAARQAREQILRKGALEGASMPGKLWDCSSRSPVDSEIFIVEGDSAAGPAKYGRDARTQAILPLRGKVLNVERARLDKMLANKEIVALFKAIGVGIDEQFDIDNLRYHKIILMMDADVDGSHIATLLLTFFYRYMRPVIEAGHLYLSQPPTHAFKLGKKIHYIFSDAEYMSKLEELIAAKEKRAAAKKAEEIAENEADAESESEEAAQKDDLVLSSTLEKKAGVSVTRFKGLGEMNGEQLRETTMDPHSRVLLQIKIEDAEKADAVFSKLMGDEVELRKNFIQTHAKFVKGLDKFSKIAENNGDDQVPEDKPAAEESWMKVKISPITETMEDSFLRYSMSVIVARALPDVRDGLKPVHRRILFTMDKNGIRSGGKTVKSARIIGDVMGKYHPHGNLAIYDAMARLAVDWSTRYLLVIGQGSFGTMDGDPPAADRYTEAKLSKHAEVLLEDLNKQTVDFKPNYDGTELEPEVLPAKLPNLLLNGQIGIAVGMATSIPPHNLAEVIDASIEIIDNPEAGVEDVLKHIKGPDFPTGGIVYGGESMRAAYTSGRGGVIVRGRAEIEERNKQGAQRIVVSEIPYGVNISSMIEKMADLVREKKITAISDIRDESARGKIRVVIDLKKDAYPRKVLNQLYKHTPLQNAFHYNMLALIDGIQPRVLGVVDIIKEHVKHRREVVRRRTEFELKQAKDRAHILEGLALALDHIDEIIALIRGSETTERAKAALIKKFKLTDIQASAILAMQLRSLAGLERKKVLDELAELNKLIGKLEKLLASDAKILEVVRNELLEVKEKFSDARRSQMIAHDLDKFSDEDLIPNEQVLVTLTIINYVKRSLASEYKQQGRGGKGRRGMSTREEDLIQQMIFANTHDNLFFFTNTGRVFKLKCYEVPPTRLDAKGTNIANLLQLRSDESISAMFKIDKDDTAADGFLFMCTKKGVVKKTSLSHYQNLRQNGLINIRLDQGDELKWVRLSSGSDEVIISTAKGQANRFSETDVRAMGRSARGVRGIRLRPGDSVVGMDLVRPDVEVVLISSKGYGKRTKMEQFAAHKRGGVGVRSAALSERTGDLMAVRSLSPRAKEIVAISERGKTIRVDVKRINRLQRATQGVRLMRLDAGDSIASLVVIEEDEEQAAEQAEKKEAKKKKKPARAKSKAKGKK